MSYNRLEFKDRAALGDVPGVKSVYRPGNLQDFDKDETFAIWGVKGAYTFSATADINGISSSSISDTQEVAVVGLDANYNEVMEIITLTGRVKATFSNPMLRILDIQNYSDTDFAGTIYASTSTAVLANGAPSITDTRGMVVIGTNISQMSIYTVPSNKVFLLKKINAYARKRASTGDISYLVSLHIKPYGKAELKYILHPASSEGGPIERTVEFPIKIAEKSDVWIEIYNDSTSNGDISTSIEGLEVDI